MLCFLENVDCTYNSKNNKITKMSDHLNQGRNFIHFLEIFILEQDIFCSMKLEIAYFYSQFFPEGSFKKYVLLKLPVFEPPSPLVPSCSFYMYPLLPQRTFALVSYSSPSSSKKFRDAYDPYFELKNWGWGGGEKRKKTYVFCKLNIKDSMFFTQLYMQ